MFLPDPRRRELGPELHNEHHWDVADEVDFPIHRFDARGVGLVHILEDLQYRLAGADTRDTKNAREKFRWGGQLVARCHAVEHTIPDCAGSARRLARS